MTVAAILALIILGALASLQLLLALGAPLGDYAWSGKYRTLPRKLRVASLLAIVVYALFAAVTASLAGIIEVIPKGTAVTAFGWVIVVFFALSIAANFASPSQKERRVMTLLAVLLTACMAYVVFAA